MFRKITWVFVALVMLLSLAVASCEEEQEEGKVVEEDEGQVITTVKGMDDEEDEVVDEKDALLSPEVPKYGGTFIYSMFMDVMGFDPIKKLQMECSSLRFTNEELMRGDWAKGMAGTGETDWTGGFIGRIELETGSLAESWETPDNETIVFYIRPGIHYGLDPNSEASRYVNGREYTAEDAAYSIDQNFNTETAYSYMAYTRAGYGPTSIEVTDKYTVKVKVPETMHGLMLLVMGDNMFQVCPDVTEKYGDQSDWRNQVGTGPYFLNDYVTSSSLTYKRNPGYWMNDPLHPENQLPYLDTIKSMVIPDLSTRLSALRTGKIDQLGGISWEDAEMLMKQSLDLKYKEVVAGPTLPVMRVDKPELPYYDLKVRRAMNIAVDQQEIVDEYYEGNAVLFGVPYPPTPTYSEIFTPLEEQSAEVQEMYTYNPARAKELLAEAGYADGFKTYINCSSAEADYLSIIREYLLDVGIDMEIKPLEASVMRSVGRGRTHEEMITMFCVDYPFPFRLLMVRQESFDNRAYFEHPFTRQSYESINAVVGKNDAEVNRLIKAVGKFSLEQAWGIWMPAPYLYTMWWPWVQNYHGEGTIGYDSQNTYNHYIWTDMDMKKAMGY
ncbi:ABC transporter substrate-binding protein [Chloroflexota bacterium]